MEGRDIQRSVSGNDVSFEGLRDGLTPVYIQIPFDMTKTFSGWLREVLKAGFDPMLAKFRCSSCSTNS
ncbi:hypothetical protein [Sinorhizobium meliloti]|uniref:hypothetical protein n=1 Tax=Rhizobium meliloti TaxID=382 RepID=UPI00038013D6|nr:hypothetical protein [Sinorhizobium meliloti]